MGRTVEAFNAITSNSLTEEQGWLFMGLLKMVRSQSGDFKSDNFEDEAAYAALRGECASRVVKDSLTTSTSKAAEIAADDGWIKWDAAAGLPIPANDDVMVTARYKNGETDDCKVGSYLWDLIDDDYQIIAYRIHKAGE